MPPAGINPYWLLTRGIPAINFVLYEKDQGSGIDPVDMHAWDAGGFYLMRASEDRAHSD